MINNWNYGVTRFICIEDKVPSSNLLCIFDISNNINTEDTMTETTEMDSSQGLKPGLFLKDDHL